MVLYFRFFPEGEDACDEAMPPSTTPKRSEVVLAAQNLIAQIDERNTEAIDLDTIRRDTGFRNLSQEYQVKDNNVLDFLAHVNSGKCSGKYRWVGGLDYVAVGRTIKTKHAEERQTERNNHEATFTRIVQTIANRKFFTVTGGDFPPVYAKDAKKEGPIWVMTGTVIFS